MRTEDWSTLSGWIGTTIRCWHKNIMLVPYNPLDWSLNNVATLFNQREFPFNLHLRVGVKMVTHSRPVPAAFLQSCFSSSKVASSLCLLHYASLYAQIPCRVISLFFPMLPHYHRMRRKHSYRPLMSSSSSEVVVHYRRPRSRRCPISSFGDWSILAHDLNLVCQINHLTYSFVDFATVRAIHELTQPWPCLRIIKEKGQLNWPLPLYVGYHLFTDM